METAQLDAFDNAITHINGIPELGSTWVNAHKGEFDFVDVREPHELDGPLGVAEGVRNIPLQAFLADVDQLDKGKPMVIICRSGRRSAIAARACRMSGVEHVASVEGGTLAWNHEVLGLEDIHATEKEANTHNLSEAIFTTNGVPEVTIPWVAANLGRFRLVDVRQPDELLSGAVVQAENVPLGTLLEATADWDKDAPYVIMCRSGGRSARAALSLLNAGFTNVASMEGGMMGWARIHAH